jgi:hypothetical protein
MRSWRREKAVRGAVIDMCTSRTSSTAGRNGLGEACLLFAVRAGHWLLFSWGWE